MQYPVSMALSMCIVLCLLDDWNILLCLCLLLLCWLYIVAEIFVGLIFLSVRNYRQFQVACGSLLREETNCLVTAPLGNAICHSLWSWWRCVARYGNIFCTQSRTQDHVGGCFYHRSSIKAQYCLLCKSGMFILCYLLWYLSCNLHVFCIWLPNIGRRQQSINAAMMSIQLESIWNSITRERK